MHYLIKDIDGVRYGKFETEQQATEVAQQLSNSGTYVTIDAYDNDTTSHLLNFVYSSNKTNWIGRGGSWNTNN